MQQLLGIVVLSVLLGGCTTSEPEHPPAVVNDALQEVPYAACPEQRPEMCTHEYRPVCADLGNDQWHTYGNACTACTDMQVQGYVPDACEVQDSAGI